MSGTDKLPSQAQSTMSISSTVRDLSDAKVAEANLNQQQKVDGEQDRNASDKLPSQQRLTVQVARPPGIDRARLRAELRSISRAALCFGLAGNLVDVLVRGAASIAGTLLVIGAALVLVVSGAAP